MTNIVTKLRNLADHAVFEPHTYHEAADKIVMLWKEIQELKADRRAAMTENHDLWREVERLRAALLEVSEAVGDSSAYWIARTAPAKEKTDD
jgi:regulator of replication initiation timing